MLSRSVLDHVLELGFQRLRQSCSSLSNYQAMFCYGLLGQVSSCSDGCLEVVVVVVKILTSMDFPIDYIDCIDFYGTQVTWLLCLYG